MVALTRWGFGGSSAPATGYDVATRVDDLRLALDRLGLERVVLVHLDAALNSHATSGANPPIGVSWSGWQSSPSPLPCRSC